MAESRVTRPNCSSRCSSSVCKPAAFAPTTAPGGEQAALTTLRKLPRGRVRSDSAREVTSALQALTGARIDAVKIAAVAPGAFTLSIEADGLEATVRLDGTGARVTSVGT